MDFREYQKKTKNTLVKNGNSPKLLLARLTLGIPGETGELCEKVKKFLRGDRKALKGVDKELGDLLWYVARVADLLGYNLNTIAEDNIIKLADRKKRGKIRGSGDNR